MYSLVEITKKLRVKYEEKEKYIQSLFSIHISTHFDLCRLVVVYKDDLLGLSLYHTQTIFKFKHFY